MRKLFLIAAALSATLVHAQDAENVGNSAQLSIISRLDASPVITFGAGTEFNFSNSGISALLDGSFSDNFSYEVYTQFLNPTPGDLYGSFLNGYWLRIATLSYETGSFFITAGKSYISLPIHEMDVYDHDAHFDMASSFWYNYAGYQWGAKTGLYYDDEGYLLFDVSASPYTGRPFESGILSYTLATANTTGGFSYGLSAGLIGINKGNYLKNAAAGISYSTDTFTIGTDVMYRFQNQFGIKETNIMPYIEYSPLDKWTFMLKGVIESASIGKVETAYYPLADSETNRIGLGAHWFPITGTDALRCHGLIVYFPNIKTVTLNLGVLYNLSLNLNRHNK